MAQVHLSVNTWWEGRPGMWRPGPAHRWHPTQGDGTTARGSFPTFCIQSHTDACTHVGAVVRWDRFSTIEKRRWGCAGCHAPSARVRESDDATARAVCRPSVSVHTDACTQVGAGRRWSDFGPSGNGDGDAPAGACSLRGCESAMARRRGQFAYIGDPVMPMLAHKLARAVDDTDFGPSRNGGSGAAPAHTLRECRRTIV